MYTYTVMSHDNNDVLKRLIFVKSTMLHSTLFYTVGLPILSLKKSLLTTSFGMI